MSAPTRIVTDPRGRIVEVSPDACDLFAIDDGRLVGKPLAVFVAEERRGQFRDVLRDLSRGGAPIGVSLPLRRRDGQRLAVDVEAVAERRGDRFEWLLAQTPEAVEEEPAAPAEALRASQLRGLLSRLPIGVVGLNADLAVEYVNPAARVYVGGVTVGALLPDPWPAFSLRSFAHRLFGPSPPVRQVAEAAKGLLIEVDGISGGPADTALLVLQDVTSSERQRRAERDFVANAAHELRTPIAAIGSALEVLQRGAKDTPADRDLFLAHIERESERLGRLVGALLLLARVQTGQETPALQVVDVAPLLAEIVAQIEPRRGVRARVECESGVALLADADLLRQAVWNLAVNAAAHTEEGEIVLAGRDLGDVSEIEVRDSGPGISKAQQDHVFDRFFRVQQRAGGGFGLGLPISREITRALGGTLTLDSKLGVGTRVLMSFPSARLVPT